MQPVILIYDGECPMCLRAMAWLKEKQLPGAFTFLPCQDAQRPPQVEYETCMEAIQLVLPNGSVYSGAECFPHIFSRLKNYRWLTWLLLVPGARILAPYVYAAIARNRLAISALLIKKEVGKSCDREKGCK